MTPRRADWALSLAVIGLNVLLFAPLWLLPGRYALTGTDLQDFFSPIYQFINREVRGGTLPLWNPYQFLGGSTVGNAQYALFYPPNWLLWLAPPAELDRVLRGLVAGHAAWAGLGASWMARRSAPKPRAALLAGLVFSWSSFLAARVEIGHYTLILALAWAPWVLHGYQTALAQRRLFGCIPGALALAMQVSAGHPQTVYITGLGLGVLTLAALIRQHSWVVLRQATVMGGLALWLSAVSWVPMLDYHAETVRATQGRSLTFADEFALSPQELITGLALPNYAGTAAEYPGFYEEVTVYWGLLPLLGLLLARRMRFPGRWLALGLIVLGLWLSLGSAAGLYRLTYTLIPISQGFRAPGRHLLLTGLGLAILLGATFTHMARLPLADQRRLLRPLWRWQLPGIAVWMGGLALLWEGRAAQQATEAAIVLAGLAMLALTWARIGWRWAWVVALLLLMADTWRISAPLLHLEEAQPSAAWSAAAQVIPTDAPGRVRQMPPPPGTPNGGSLVSLRGLEGYDPWHQRTGPPSTPLPCKKATPAARCIRCLACAT
ncbi:MAG: YfhO family protein, partial [Anaerolineae bacterium]|nr:YfhO family protein [Anaerolineae bacterium]